MGSGQQQRWRGQRGADAAAAPFPDVADDGRGRRGTVDGGRDGENPRHAAKTAAADGGRRLRDRGQVAVHVAAGAAAVAHAAQAEEVVRRDQEPRVRRVLHHTQVVQFQPDRGVVGPRPAIRGQAAAAAFETGARVQHDRTVPAAAAPVADPRTRVRRR